MDIKLLLENAYVGNDFAENKSEYIYDYGSHKLTNGVKEFSRYDFPLLESTYDPYVISRLLLESFSRKFTVINNNSVTINNVNDCIVCYNKNNAVLCEFTDKNLLTEPLITDRGDYTTLGLLAIIFQRSYGDEYFRDRVESDLRKIRYKDGKIGNMKYLMYERSSPMIVFNETLRSRNSFHLDLIFCWKD